MPQTAAARIQLHCTCEPEQCQARARSVHPTTLLQLQQRFRGLRGALTRQVTEPRGIDRRGRAGQLEERMQDDVR
ncbi:MAG: hypothetical protein ABW321_07740 [Polyangiales bacterium]